jgi:hypothetical protein
MPQGFQGNPGASIIGRTTQELKTENTFIHPNLYQQPKLSIYPLNRNVHQQISAATSNVTRQLIQLSHANGMRISQL